MQLLADLVARLGAPGAAANAGRSLDEARQAALRVERFLARFDHPAAQADLPRDSAQAEPARVA